MKAKRGSNLGAERVHKAQSKIRKMFAHHTMALSRYEGIKANLNVLEPIYCIIKASLP